MEVREIVERLLEAVRERPVRQKSDERVGEIVLLMADNAAHPPTQRNSSYPR